MTLRLCLEQALCGRVLGKGWMRGSPAVETKMLCESLGLPLCNLPIAIPPEMMGERPFQSLTLTLDLVPRSLCYLVGLTEM